MTMEAFNNSLLQNEEKEVFKLLRGGEYQRCLDILRELADIKGIEYFARDINYCESKLYGAEYCIDTVKISVIIPAYNAGEYMERAIRSVLAQSLKEVEIICCDDGSTDNTLSLINKMAALHKNIKVMHSSDNFGQGKRRNEALKVVRGQYVTFLDADDYYNDANFFQHAYDEAVKNNYDIVLTPYQRNKKGSLSRDKIADENLSGHAAAQKFLARDFGTHAPGAKFIKRIIARNCFFVDYGYSQDVTYVFKALLKAGKVRVLKKYGYVYFNDNVSSWRPTELTARHFYSSLRLLAEIIIEYFRLNKFGLDINIKSFLATWTKEHGKRISEFLAMHGNDSATRFIINKFSFIHPYILLLLNNAIDCSHFYKKYKIPNDENYNKYKPYLDSLLNNFKKLFIDSGKQNDCQKNVIVIYCMMLAYGGLEKVASQVGNVLSDEYNIVYVLDRHTDITYEHTGSIVINNLLDPEVVSLIARAKFIFDFKYKDVRIEDPLCMYCVRNFHEKYISTIHNTLGSENYFQKTRDYLYNAKIEDLKKILCVSKNVKTIFETLYGKHRNVAVMENPVNFQKLDNAPDAMNEYGPYILFLGRLTGTRHKGIDILLRAFAISSIRDKCRLLLAGHGDFDRRCTHIINYYSLAREIIKPGFNENISPLVRNALFLAAPSRWEGFSLTLIESLALGTPPLTTRVGGAMEIVRPGVNGWFCEVDDIQSTRAGLEYMYSHAHEMRPNCRPSVEWLDISRYGQKIKSWLK